MFYYDYDITRATTLIEMNETKHETNCVGSTNAIDKFWSRTRMPLNTHTRANAKL